MKIIRVFPRRTSYTPKNDLSFIGDPKLDRPEADEIHISCLFTWDKAKCEMLQSEKDRIIELKNERIKFLEYQLNEKSRDNVIKIGESLQLLEQIAEQGNC